MRIRLRKGRVSGTVELPSELITGSARAILTLWAIELGAGWEVTLIDSEGHTVWREVTK